MSVNRRDPTVKPRTGSQNKATSSAAGRSSSSRDAAPLKKPVTRPTAEMRLAESTRSTVQEIAERVHSELDAITAKVAQMTSEIVDKPKDPFGVVGEIFADELRSLLGDALPDPGAVRRAARLAVAEQAWMARIGNLLDTRDVVELLGVSKQRVSTLAREHRLIALPQTGRLQFPAWQFAVPDAKDRECLAAAHNRLVEVGALSPWSAASWFQAEHPELDGHDPVGYLREGGDRRLLLTVAGRDAERLAQ